MLEASLESGVTFFDTADVYGDGRSERSSASSWPHPPTRAVTIATKMGRRVPQEPENYTLDNFRSWTDRSRRNLGVDTLDLVQLHCPPTAVYESDAVFDALDALVDEGAIAAYGVSVEETAQALSAIERPAVRDRPDHPQRVPAEAPRRGAPRSSAAGGGHHRACAAGVRPAQCEVHGEHHLRRERPPHIQPARRGIRRG